MKKVINIILSALMAISLVGCFKMNPTYEIQENVKLTLSDVLKVSNVEQNTVYYYYLLDVENNSEADYDISNLIYEITDDKEADINAIDQSSTIPMSIIKKGQTGYIAGYVGFPNNNQKNIGLYFPKEDQFFSFKNIKVREASNDNVASKQVGMAQTLYEDKDIKIGYDYSQMQINFYESKTVVSNFYISYENKTDQRIAVPFVTPYAKLTGLLTSDYPYKCDWANANIETIQSLDFTDEELLIKNIGGTSSGYALLYLEPEQSLSCNCSLEFFNSFICYQFEEENPIEVDLICAALGVNRTINLPKYPPDIENAVNEDLVKQEETEETSEEVAE